MIANSGGNENGQLYGGVPGDQTGREWCVREWYSCPWLVVLRYPDQTAAQEAAYLARRAAGNDHIGYNQLSRLSFWNALSATGTYDPADISTACDDDCSSGVTAVWKAVGKRLGISALADLDPATYTGNLRARFVAAGFKALTGGEYTASPDRLMPGDVLLRDGYHTALNLDLGDLAGAWSPGTGKEETMDITSSGADFTGGTYRVTPSDGLNVRDAPGLTSSIVAHYTQGMTIVLDAWCTVADGYVWGRYTGSTSGKTRYVAIGKAHFKASDDDYLVSV